MTPDPTPADIAAEIEADAAAHGETRVDPFYWLRDRDDHVMFDSPPGWRWQ